MSSTEPELASIEVALRPDQTLARDTDRQREPLLRAEPAGSIQETVGHGPAPGIEEPPIAVGAERRPTSAITAAPQLEQDLDGEPLDRDERDHLRRWPARTAAREPEHPLEPDRQPSWEI